MSFEYWYLLPISIAVATVSMSTGIGGAVFFSPIFLLGLKLNPPVAIGTALITEFFGFGSGLIAYLRQRLIDYKLGIAILIFSVPAGVIGASIADFFSPDVLKGIFATGIIFVGSQIFTAWWGERRERLGMEPAPETVEGAHPIHVVVDRSGKRYEFPVFNRAVAVIYSSIGGAFVGMISVGLAELMEYQMVAKCRIPAAVAVATSIFVVVVTVAAASIGHIIAFVSQGPEVVDQVVSIAMFTVPGVIIGGQIGPKVQRMVDPEKTKLFISAVFIGVGAFMLASLAFS